MAAATPTQAVALEMVSHPSNVKVDVGDKASPGLSMPSKLAHALALVVAAVIMMAVGIVLADGASVIKLKNPEDLPRLTAKTTVYMGQTIDLKAAGLDYRADELLGPAYGIGLHHDSAGYFWTQAGAEWSLQKYIDELGLHQVINAVPSVVATDGLKHPVEFLTCTELQKAGLSAFGLGIVAEVVAGLMVFFHGAALLGLIGGKLAKALSALVWLTLTLGFLIVVCLAVGVFTTTWTCDNPFVPEILLSEHFNYNYGFGFAIIGFACSLLVFAVQLFFTSTADGEVVHVAEGKSDHKMGLAKVLAVVTVGLILGSVSGVVVAAANDAFEDGDAVDPEVNPCAGQKPYHAGPGDLYFKNVDCMKDGLVAVLEQAGANVTRGYVGGLDAGSRRPISKDYDETALCPVNVHWHLGAEHLSEGEYDHHGTGPAYKNGTNGVHGYHDRDGEDYISKEEHDEKKEEKGDPYDRRRLGAEGGWEERLGLRCHHYNDEDEMFKTAATNAAEPYVWEHCVEMMVGETYEVHWPHSAAGACGTEWQYQTPFYDGVFCKDGIVNILTPLNTYKKIGVQGQVFTIVNSDEPQYQYDNLIDGAWVDGTHWADVAKYTGSTTGTTRDNEVCSRYAPITWQVDRKCHMISAKSFDKLCYDMKQKKDDMSADLYPHGAREVSSDHLVANNQETRRHARE